MAGLKRLVLAYRPSPAGAPVWPRDVRWRLLVYVLLVITAWLVPPWGVLAAGMITLAIGRRLDWLAWSRALGWFWLIVAAPLLTLVLGGLPAMPPTPEILDAAWRCLTVLVLLMASQWLTATTTIFEIQTALRFVLRPFGRRVSLWLSFLASLAIGFVPWVLDEVRAVQEASSLRGGGKRKLSAHLAAFGLPVFSRVFAKARHTAEAIELRGGLAD